MTVVAVLLNSLILPVIIYVVYTIVIKIPKLLEENVKSNREIIQKLDQVIVKMDQKINKDWYA